MEALAAGRAPGALEERRLAHRRAAADGARWCGQGAGRPTVLRRHLAVAPLMAAAAPPRPAATSLATRRRLCAAATAATAAPAARGVAWRGTGAAAARPAARGAFLAAGRWRLGRAAHLHHGQERVFTHARASRVPCTCHVCTHLHEQLLKANGHFRLDAFKIRLCGETTAVTQEPPRCLMSQPSNSAYCSRPAEA